MSFSNITSRINLEQTKAFLRDARAGHGHQGDGDLAVVDGSRGQHARDRDLAAGDIDVQLVADPGLLVALAVFLGADIAGGGEIREHLAGGLRRLTLQARWFRLWPFAGSFLAFSRASVFVLRRNAGGWWRRTVFLVFLDRFLTRLDFGGV